MGEARTECSQPGAGIHSLISALCRLPNVGSAFVGTLLGHESLLDAPRPLPSPPHLFGAEGSIAAFVVQAPPGQSSLPLVALSFLSSLILFQTCKAASNDLAFGDAPGLTQTCHLTFFEDDISLL